MAVEKILTIRADLLGGKPKNPDESSFEINKTWYRFEMNGDKDLMDKDTAKNEIREDIMYHVAKQGEFPTKYETVRRVTF